MSGNRRSRCCNHVRQWFVRLSTIAWQNSQSGHEHDAIKYARADYCSVLDVIPLQEWYWRKVLFPDEECREEQESDDEHSNDVARLPAIGRIGCDVIR